MEISSFRSFSELGMDEPLFLQQWPAYTPLENLNPVAPSFHEDFQHQPTVLDFKRPAESSVTWSNRPSKQLKPATWDSSCNLTTNQATGMVKPKKETHWPSPYYNNTAALNLPSDESTVASFGSQNYTVNAPGAGSRRVTTAQDHILAERKRREIISQRLIALSALVPGLKKMDKASILGDAAKYLNHLQDKIKILEEQSKKRTMEKLVFTKKYEIYPDGGNCSSSSSDESISNAGEPLPEIQARFCNKDVLIIINCEKRKGVLEKTVAEIEKLNLSVFNSSVMAFGDYAVNITLLAKIDDEFTLDMKELVNNLRSALRLIM